MKRLLLLALLLFVLSGCATTMDLAYRSGANQKISDLTELSEAPADTDLVPVVDISDTTMGESGTNKKVTYLNFMSNAVTWPVGISGAILYSGGESDPSFGSYLSLPALSEAPGSPVAGAVYRADNDNWDPCNLTGTNDYWCVYTNASTYIIWFDIAGNFYMVSIDMTGGTVILPNSTDPTTSSAGSIGVDTDDNFIEFYGNATGRVVEALKCETFSIGRPAELDDDIVLKHFMADAYPHGVTLKDIAISTSASATDTHVIEEWSDRAGTSQTTVESIALSSSQYQEDDGTLSDSAIAADAFLVLNKDDSTDNLAEMEITITYYINAGD